jgi:hypothetical protein
MQLDSKKLPVISELKLRAKALAMLDAIIAPDWEDRYYSYNRNWCAGEEMASMRNGSGDDWFILFGEFGAAIKGLDHESKIAGNSVLSKEVEHQLPKSFSSFYYELEIPLELIEKIYSHHTITEQIVQALNPGLPFALAKEFAAEIGYPT